MCKISKSIYGYKMGCSEKATAHFIESSFSLYINGLFFVFESRLSSSLYAKFITIASLKFTYVCYIIRSNVAYGDKGENKES